MRFAPIRIPFLWRDCFAMRFSQSRFRYYGAIASQCAFPQSRFRYYGAIASQCAFSQSEFRCPNAIASQRALPQSECRFFDAIVSQRISSFRNANSHEKTFCESVRHLLVKIGKNPIYLMRLISILLQRLLAEWTLCRFASFAFCLPFAFQAASSFGLCRLHSILR